MLKLGTARSAIEPKLFLNPRYAFDLRSMKSFFHKSKMLLAALALLAGCTRVDRSPVQPLLREPFPQKLSEWHLFVGRGENMRPNQRVLPYDLNTPLFSDYAAKHRFVWMPAGTSAQYREDQVFDFPVGAILVKSFGFPSAGGKEKLIETRLLIHGKDGWVGLAYIWNDKQTDAILDLVPDPVPVTYVDQSGKPHRFTYYIPNANECKQCHENARVMLPIGPKARNLNRDYAYADGVANQLMRWTSVGYLQGAPLPEAAPRSARWDLAESGTLDERARAYLDNNCAHCHQPGATAGYTGFDLRSTSSDPAELGVCRSPNSAGRVGTLIYDLVPGKPEESILVARMESTRPKEMMPQIGRSVVHEEGVALVREWVRSLSPEGASCASSGER
ncbi:MAG TPA: SO2930 family diheme c-type cytochrome [Candidatus Angelobacter sp.]|nr:SO2930 family diheme c-type cytochrome [Candidatus Angelobacter sp.]